jgi:hypothetical protein
MTDVISADDTEPEDRRLCSRCIGDAFLRTEIEKEGEPGTCSYCNEPGCTISIGDVADRIDTVFEEHFQRTATEPSSMEYTMMKEGDYDWEREGDPVVYVIASAAGIDEEPAEDIRHVLEDRHGDMELAQIGEEGPYDEEAHYVETEVDDTEFRENWHHFETSLKTEARFFSAAAEETLERAFEGLADHKMHDGKSIIFTAGPGTDMPALYRARVFQSIGKLEEALKRPDQEVGSPPAVSAIAGRMNARGISVFYGATDPTVAIGEVRPPVGSRVAVGRFELLRPVRLLNVTALRSVYVKGSIFDARYIARLERAKFLERLSDRITTPVMPDDEPLDYLVTQTIADYLANRSDTALDGILYPSVQGLKGGVNLVLFHKAARVAPIELPPGTEIDVQSGYFTDEGWEYDYWVQEDVPPKEPTTPEDKPDHFRGLAAFIAKQAPYDDDPREPTLRVDLESLDVHHITAAKLETRPFSVRRSRPEKSEKGETPF